MPLSSKFIHPLYRILSVWTWRTSITDLAPLVQTLNRGLRSQSVSCQFARSAFASRHGFFQSPLLTHLRKIPCNLRSSRRGGCTHGHNSMGPPTSSSSSTHWRKRQVAAAVGLWVTARRNCCFGVCSTIRPSSRGCWTRPTPPPPTAAAAVRMLKTTRSGTSP